MALARNLKSFVAERERQLDAKVVATARGQLPAAVRHYSRAKSFAGLRPHHYRAALESKFTQNSARAWPMHYEVTPRDPAPHNRP